MTDTERRRKALARARAWYQNNLVRRKLYAATWEARNRAKRRRQMREWRKRVRLSTSHCEYATCDKPKGRYRKKFCNAHGGMFYVMHNGGGGGWRRRAASSTSSITPSAT